MKLKFLRFVSFLLLLTFSFHQISFAYPVPSLPISEAHNTKYDLAISIYDSHVTAISAQQNGGSAASYGGQAASFLLPGLGQVLGMAFQGLGYALQGAGFALNLAGSLAYFIPIIGPFVGAALQIAGRIVSIAGSVLVQVGSAIREASQTLFKDQKNPFSRIQDSFKGSFNQLNPITYYKSALPDGVRLKTPSASAKFLSFAENPTSFPIPGGTDKSIINSLLRIVLDTAMNAAIGAIQGQVEQLFSSNQTQIAGTRAPPVNAPSAERNSQTGSIQINDPNRTHPSWTVLQNRFGSNIAFAQDDQGIPKSYRALNEQVMRNLNRLSKDTFQDVREDGRVFEFIQNAQKSNLELRIKGNLGDEVLQSKLRTPELRSSIPQLTRPTSGFRNVLDQEFTTQDIEASLANLNAAFSTHRSLANNTFFHNLEESITARGQDILFGRFSSFVSGGNSVFEFLFDAAGVTDKIESEFIPGRQLTNWGREQVSGVFQKFLNFVNEDKFRISSYEHISERFNPSFVNRVIDAGFKNAPFYGDLTRILNINGPKPGDFIHTVRFVTQDFSGFFRQGELSFVYGPFMDGSGSNHAGVVQVSFRVRKASVPYFRQLQPTYEESKNAPWL